jgi:hypothetical protein
MHMRIADIVRGLVLATTAAVLPLASHAESNVQTGTATATPGATAHVDFQITIPKILYLRVGSGSSYTTNVLTAVTTVDLVQFAPAATVVGNSSIVNGTGGDLTGGVETAAIVSNSGNVTLNATANGAGISDGNADFIAFSQISTASTKLNSTTPLPAPTLTNGTSGNVTLTAPATKLIVQDAKWTYTYLNQTNPPAGTYGGAGGTNNGRVTYTATMP